MCILIFVVQQYYQSTSQCLISNAEEEKHHQGETNTPLQSKSHSKYSLINKVRGKNDSHTLIYQ